jgi:hypothetical protein
MDLRAPDRWSWGWAALIVAAQVACGGDAGRSSTLSNSDSLVAGDGVALVWHIQTADPYSCRTHLPDYAVRQLQLAYGSRLPFVVVHVGEPADLSVPLGYLRQRRIHYALTISMSSAEHRRQFSRVEVPSLQLVHGKDVLWSSTEGAEGVVSHAALAAVLTSLIDRAARQSGPLDS